MASSWTGSGEAVPVGVAPSVTDLLNEAPRSKFHRRTVLVSGVGFFTDAYDLFVISTVATIVATQWHLSTLQTSWVTGSAILGAFFGAVVFGRIADVLGRKVVYLSVAVIMMVGAIASAVAPGFIWLVIARFVLGVGIGGDYPVSAVLMSEYSNRRDRGRLVGMVFSMQALGLVVGPLVGLALLSSGISNDMVWRLMLAFGAIPAAGVIYLRSKMPESPRFKAQVQGKSDQAGEDLATFSNGVVETPTASAHGTQRMRLSQFLGDRRMLMLLLGTAGSWFLFDYAYYGNTLSLPAILKQVDSSASLETKLLWTLGHVRRLRRPGLHRRRPDHGPDRAPPTPVHRVRSHGRGIPHPRRLRPPHHHGRPVPGHLRAQLLLRRVRPEYDDVRPTLRGLSGQHAHHRARNRRRGRQARGLRGRLPGTPAAEALRPPRDAGHRRCSRRSRLRARPASCRNRPGGISRSSATASTSPRSPSRSSLPRRWRCRSTTTEPLGRPWSKRAGPVAPSSTTAPSRPGRTRPERRPGPPDAVRLRGRHRDGSRSPADGRRQLPSTARLTR